MIKNPINNFIPKAYPKGSITQFFGENVALYAAAVPGLTKGHNGIDIVAPWGSPLYAVEGGLVVEVKDEAIGYGKHIKILHDCKDGTFREWTYGHNSVNLVAIGKTVTAGQHIANMGNTGFVVSGATPYWEYNPYAGTHCHLGMRLAKGVKDGWRFYAGAPAIEILDYGNGYKGSVDCIHLFDTSQQDKVETMLSLRSALNHLKSLLGIIK